MFPNTSNATKEPINEEISVIRKISNPPILILLEFSFSSLPLRSLYGGGVTVRTDIVIGLHDDISKDSPIQRGHSQGYALLKKVARGTHPTVYGWNGTHPTMGGCMDVGRGLSSI